MPRDSRDKEQANPALVPAPAGQDEVRAAVARDRKLRETILRARLTWAMFGDDDQRTEQILELQPGAVELWRRTRAPDGRDWSAFSEEMGLAGASDLFEVVGPQDEFGFSSTTIRQAQRLINTCMTVMDEGALYDADGNEVKFLYDFEKRRVPVGGLRPKSFGEAAQGIRWLTAVVQETFERIRQLSDWEGKVARDREELVRQVVTAVQRTFGADGLQRFLQVAQGTGLTVGAAEGPAPEVVSAEVAESNPEQEATGEERDSEDEPQLF